MAQQIRLEVEFEFTPHKLVGPRYQSTRSNDEPGTIRRPVILCGVCILTFSTQDELNAHRDQKHFYCKTCDSTYTKCHRSHPRLEKHHKTAHPAQWCAFCRILFDTPAHKSSHVHAQHFSTNLAPAAVGKFYTLLNIPPTASHQQVLRAARSARIAAHPDRNNNHRLGLSRAQISDRAKEVGRAADVLCDVRQRREYDSGLKMGREP